MSAISSRKVGYLTGEASEGWQSNEQRKVGEEGKMRERKWGKETGKYTVPNNRGFTTCRLGENREKRKEKF